MCTQNAGKNEGQNAGQNAGKTNAILLSLPRYNKFTLFFILFLILLIEYNVTLQ